jgi:hypothetical protein
MAEDDRRSAVELEKIQLEIENLKLEISGRRRLAGFDLGLQLLQTITVFVAIAGFAISLYHYKSEQRQHQQDSVEAAQREFMKPLLEKQQELYVDAAAAAATIASTNDAEERKKAINTFRKLFWGPLVMVETEEVSGAMKAFDSCLNLNGTLKCDPDMIKNQSLSLASTLEASLLKNWNKKPQDFMNGQFDYRNIR